MLYVDLVLEVPDGDALVLELVVCPGDDLALHDGGGVLVELREEGQRVGAHQLPHQRQGQRLVTLHDVGTCLSETIKMQYRCVKVSRKASTILLFDI